MSRVIISNQKRVPIAELQFASNVVWRKALNSVGYATFDLPLTDIDATSAYLNAGNFVHIYSDSVSNPVFSNAAWGGVLTNDYQIKPQDGVVTCQAAGMAFLLQLSIVPATTTYTMLDTGTVIDDLVTTCDNFAALGLTRHTVSTQGPVIQSWQATWGDIIFKDATDLCEKYGGDFEVRPDWSYAYYTRQGVDNRNLVVRYGEQGNIQVDTTLHVINTEIANRIWVTSTSSTPTFVADQDSVAFYGPRTLVVQEENNRYIFLDALSRAQVELAHRANPATMMDDVTIVDTNLLPFDALNLGDAIWFDAPTLPMLSSFTGLQRVLAIEYNERKLVMKLSLGNILYLVLRNRMYHPRLFDG